MGSIKENSYTEEENDLFYDARAIAHPVRVRMMTELFVEHPYRNIDLTKMLNLSKSAMHGHIQKLKDAKMVEIVYFIHFYEVSLSAKGMVWSDFLNSQRHRN